MSLLKLKAKVKLTSEEGMEIEEQYDLGTIAKSAEWVWRDLAIPVEEVYKIISYTPSKTIVQLYDEEKILVAELFEDVYNKWHQLRKENPEKIGIHKEVSEGEEEDEDD